MKILALVLLLLLAGCAFEPEGAEPFDPPATYRAIWLATEACAGRTRPFGELTFFVVPGGGFTTSSSRLAVGHYDGHHSIYLAGDYRDTEFVIRHEMLHALGFTPHTPFPFVTCHATWSSAE
jgi:hypothetical protein